MHCEAPSYHPSQTFVKKIEKNFTLKIKKLIFFFKDAWQTVYISVKVIFQLDFRVLEAFKADATTSNSNNGVVNSSC